MQQPKKSQNIPVRRLRVTDSNQIPKDYSTTPGGSIFSTTPGGTRIFYDRDAMLMCKNSPIARSPPENLPCCPGITCPTTCKGECNRVPAAKPFAEKPVENGSTAKTDSTHAHKGDDEAFDLEL